MINRRYGALSLIPLVMLLAGFAAIGAPGPWRGPLLASQPVAPHQNLGLLFLSQPVYLADALGLILLTLAIWSVWMIAITWEFRRRRAK